MTRHDPERLLDGLELPTTPEGLRARSIEAARQARRSAPAPDLWTRLWLSPAARWGWATAVAVLLLSHVVVSFDPPTPELSSPRSPYLVASVLPDDDLADLVDLLPLRHDRLPRLDIERPGPDNPNHSPRS